MNQSRTDTSTKTNAQLLLQIVSAEKECNAGHPLTDDYFKELGECYKCLGTNKVPILDPQLMRLPCSCLVGYRNYTTSYKQSSNYATCVDCQGRIWIPNPDPYTMREALHKAGFQLVENHIPIYYKDTSLPWMANCFPYSKSASYILQVRSHNPERARFLAVIKAIENK